MSYSFNTAVVYGYMVNEERYNEFNKDPRFEERVEHFDSEDSFADRTDTDPLSGSSFVFGICLWYGDSSDFGVDPIYRDEISDEEKKKLKETTSDFRDAYGITEEPMIHIISIYS